MKKLALFAAVLLVAVSCGNKTTKKLLPSVSGKAGEVIVVMDKTPWEGDLGGVVRELLACETPYLAQREPLFSLVHVVPSNFVNLFQVHRNLVIYEVDPQLQEEGIQYLSDVWAHPQCVIKVNAQTEARAIELTRESGEVISEAIEQAERNRIIANTRLYEEGSIFPEVAEVIGGSPHFPTCYKLKKKTSDFTWTAYEKGTIQGVFVYKYPALGTEEDFTLENIIANRNRVLQQNVPGMLENTYMTTGEFLPPSEKFIHYKNFDFAQVRGFWEVYNDFMGGPFVSHSFYSQDGKEVVVAEAFVYAPRYDKRQYLRQVESLLYSFEWATSKE